MTKKSDELRRKAEEIIRLRKEIPNKDVKDQNVDRLIEELSIYQIELELQNEELVKQQQKLDESRNKYIDLFDSAPIGYLLIDEETNIIKANKTLAKKLSVPVQQLEKNKLTKYIHPDFQDHAYLQCKELFEKGTEILCEMKLRKKDDNWIYCRLAAHLDKSNDKQIARIAVFDISEAKENEQKIIHQSLELAEKHEEIASQNEELQTQNEEIRSSNLQLIEMNQLLKNEKEKAQHYLDIAGVMFIALDGDGKVSLANPKASEVLGYSINEIEGKNWFNHFLVQENIPEIKRVFNEIINGNLKSQKYVENQVKAKDGTTKWIAWHNSDVRNEKGEIIGTLSSGEDITERRQAEQKIIETKNFYESIMEGTQDGIWVSDKNDVIFYANKAMSEIAGVPVEQICGNNVLKDFPKETTEEFNKFYLKAKESLQPQSYEVTVKTPVGRQTWQNGWQIPLVENGKYDGMITTIRDVTERKKAEKALKDNEEFLQRTGQMARVGGWEIKLESNTVFWSKVTKEIHEVDEDYIPQLDEAIDFFTGESKVIISNAVNEAVTKGIPYDLELAFRTAKGKDLWVHTQGFPVMKNGKCIKLSGIFQDITDKKKRENDLLESETKFRSYIENAPDGVFIANEKGEYLEVNKAACTITGYTAEELSALKIPDLLQQDEVDKGVQHFLKVQKEGFARDEIGFVHKNGEKKWWEVDAVKLSDTRFLGFVKDTTERKKAKEKLQETSNEMQSILKSMLNAFVIFDSVYDENGTFISYRFVYINDAYEHITGVKNDEVKGKTVHEVWPGTEDSWVEKYGHVATTGETLVFDNYHEPTKKLYHCRVYRPWESNERFCVIFDDITEQRKAEIELEEKEQQLSSVINNSTNMFYQHDTNHVLTYLSPQVKNILGYEPEEAMRKWTEMASDHPQNEIGFNCTMKAIETGKPQPTYELELIHKTGRKIWVEVREVPIVKNGKTIAISGSLNDITERKEVIDQLTQSEARYRQLVETASDAFYFITEDGKIADTNDTACNLLGRSREEILNLRIDQIDPNFPVEDFQAFWKETPYNEQRVFETTHIRKDNTVFPVEISGKKFKLGDTDYYYGIARDITERKKREKELQDSEEKYRSLVESSPDGIITINKVGKVKSANKAFFELTGYDEKEIIGKNFLQVPTLIKQDLKFYSKLINDIFKGESPGAIHFKWKHANGEIREGEAKTSLQKKDGKIIGLQAVLRDVTEQKEAQRLVQESEEKYRNLVNNSLMGIVIAQSDPVRLHFVNPSMTQLTGYSEKKLLNFKGEELVNLIYEEDRERFFDNFQKRIEGKPIKQEDEYRFVTKDKKVITVNSYSSFIEYLGKPAALTTFIDITDKKKAEEKTAESEEKYSSLFNNIQEGVALHEMIWDEKGNPIDFIWLDANPTYEEITNLKKEEIVGKRGKEVIPNLEQKWLELYADVTKSGKSVSVVDHSEYLDKYWDVKAFSPGKNRFAVAMSDVTEKIHATKKLELSEKQFRSIIESTPMGTLNYELRENEELVLIGYNSAANEMLQTECSDLMGKTIEKAFPGLIDTEVPGIYRKIAKTGGQWFTEQIDYHHDKVSGAFEVYAFQTSPMKIAVMFLEITERLTDQNKIKESEERHRVLFENTGAGIGYYDLNGKLILFNKLAAQHMGGKPDDYIGKNLVELYGEEAGEEYMKRIRKAVKSESTISFEDKVELPTGAKWFLSAYSKIHDADNKVVGVQIISSDITERRLAEQELQMHKDKLEELVKERTEELASANEELHIANEDLIEKNKELERFNDLFVGREFRIKELKEKIEKLENEINRPKQ
jgi:PAS domain S-box-containing protein